MRERMNRWLAALSCTLCACGSSSSSDATIGVGITGIDNLPEDYLSVQDFSVNGYNGAQAGKGGRTVCCAILPRKWRPGLTVKVHWNVTNWRDRTGAEFDAVVPVERYEEVGHLWVHFLPGGKARAVSSARLGPNNPDYPGPHDPIPNKEPWDKYPLDR